MWPLHPLLPLSPKSSVYMHGGRRLWGHSLLSAKCTTDIREVFGIYCLLQEINLLDHTKSNTVMGGHMGANI